MSNEFTSLWEKTLFVIKNNLNDDLTFDTFFKDTSIHDIKGDTVTIIVKDILGKPVLIDYSNIIQDALNEISQSNFNVLFFTETELKEANSSKNNNENTINSFILDNNLNDSFSFDTFVVGPSNKEAFTACFTVAKAPGKIFNPLFIYSKSGLGKTHLIQSIGNYVLANNPHLKTLYVTSEQFLNDYMLLVRSNTNENNDWFNYKYRQIDILIIDDIQFLNNNMPKFKEMFFHIYNDLLNHNKQIIITSDVIPDKLEGLETRLVSRFNQGLSISINPPDIDTIVKILKNKIEYFDIDHSINISDDTLEYIAKNFKSDVRYLEGIIRSILFHLISNPDVIINKKTINNIFKDFLDDDATSHISSDNIIKTVCNYYHLSKSQIIGKSRLKEIATPRHIAIYLERTLLGTPFDKIGKKYGNRDHSTIMSSYNKIKDKIEENNVDYLSVISEISRLFKT